MINHLKQNLDKKVNEIRKSVKDLDKESAIGTKNSGN
jgi:hypothetical protein